MAKARPDVDQMAICGATYQQQLYDYSIEILRIAEPPEGYYLATSFGKDSIVAHRLCDEAGVKYDAHTNVTGIDPPELIYYGREHYPEVVREPYKMSMWRLIEKKKALPMRISRFCCEVLKEDGGRGRTCVMGIRAEESARRKKTWAPLATRNRDKDKVRMFDPDDIRESVQSCTVRGKLTVSPLYYWPDIVLWDFIRDRKMPYCKLYDEGFHRLGCVGCPMGKEKGRKKDFERWPKFKGAYARAVERAVEAGGFSKLVALGLSAAEILERWISEEVQEAAELEGQGEMHEI